MLQDKPQYGHAEKQAENEYKAEGLALLLVLSKLVRIKPPFWHKVLPCVQVRMHM